MTCTGSSIILNATGGLSYTWSPADYLNNTGDSSVISNPLTDIVYTVTGADMNGCANSDSVSIKVTHGSPVTVSPVADTICIGQSTVIIASGGISYEWSPASGLSVTTGDMVFATPDVTTTYTVTGTDSNGCKSSATTVITVNPLPNISALTNPTICIGSTATLDATGGVTYTWSPSTGLSATTGNSVTANPLVTTTYIVTGENAYGCGSFTTVTVTVGAGLSIQINSASAAICKGDTVALNAYGADNYTWSPSTGLSASAGQAVDANPNFTTTYTITGTDNNGCSGDTTFVVTVHINPVISSSDYSVCSGDSVLLSVTGATSYSWSPITDLSDYTGNNVIAKPATSVTYTITGVNTFGCIDTTISLVTVNPAPQTAIIKSNSLICNSSPPITLSATPVGGLFTGTGVSGNLFYPDSAGTGSPTVIHYSFTNTYGCSDTDSMIVTVYPSPSVTVTPNTPTICINSSTPLSVIGADTYKWTPATGLSSTADSLIIAAPDSTTTYTVIGINHTGCFDSASVIVKVSPLPVVTVSPSVTSICNGSSATLSASGAVNYQWTPSTGLNTDTGAIVTANPTSSTTYTVFGTDTLGCYSTAIGVVNVGAPVHIINTPTNPVICKMDSVNIMLAGADSYTWTPSTGLSATTGANVTASPTITTSYTVIGIDANGCSGQVSFEVKVNPALRINGYTTAICKGNSAVLTATGANLFLWSADSTLSSLYGATVTATPNISTTYTVTGWNSFGCSDTAQFTVMIHQPPSVQFTGLKSDYCILNSTDTLMGIPSGGTFTGTGISGNIFNPFTAGIGGPYAVTYSYTDSLGCSDTITQHVRVNNTALITVTPDNSTICTGSSAVLSASGANNFLWSPSAGLSSTTGSSVTAAPTINTTYTVSGTDVNGCSGSATVEINTGLKIPVIPSAILDSICAGSFTILSASGADNYTWLPSTGLSTTSGSSITASPSVTTTYTVTGYDAGGCTGDTTLIVTVNPLPVILVNNETICSGNTTKLIPSGAAQYQWLPGNITGDSIVVSPNTSTTYSITGILNGCSNSVTAVVTVEPLPVITVNNASICQDNFAVLAATGAAKYLWSNGDTTESITVHPASTTTYTVTGYINNCKNDITATVTVNTKPIVTLSGLNPNYCSSSTVDTLIGFPAGGIYEGKGVNGNYFYPSIAGGSVAYAVKYTYTTTAGCSDSAIQHTTINAGAVITATPTKPSICINSSSVISANGGVKYSWTPSTGLSSTTGNTVTASPKSSTTYTVTGMNADGCSGNAVVTVQVKDNPIINIISGNPAICIGSSATINVSGAMNYSWLPADGLNTVTGNPVIASPSVTTTYSVTGINTNGCSSSAKAVVTVNPVPTVSVSSDKKDICYHSSATFTAAGANSYTWSPSIELSATTGDVISASPLSDMTYTVTGISTKGCTSSDTVTISVNPPIVMSLHASKNTICSGDSVSLNVTGATNYSWTPSTGLNTSSGPTVTATLISSVTYTVTGYDSNGCSGEINSVVTVNPLPAITVSSNTSSLCIGTSAELTASGALSYSWNPSTGLSASSGNSLSAIPTSSLTYTVTGIDINGCSAQNSIPLTVNPKPVLNISVSNPSICLGTSTNISVDGALNYKWSPAVGLNTTTGVTVIANPVTTSSYSVTGTDLNGCTDTSAVTVEVLPNPVIKIESSVSTLCSGQSATLQASGASVYEWSPLTGLNVSTGDNIIASPATEQTYTVTGTNSSGCSGAASIILNVHPNPVVTVSKGADICIGSSASLNATGDGSFSWFPDASLTYPFIPNPTASPSVTTTYTVSVTNTIGCVSSDSVIVTVHHKPYIDAGRDTLVCKGGFVQLHGQEGKHFEWIPQDYLSDSRISDPVCIPLHNITYTLTVTDEFGCSNTDSVQIFLKDSMNIHASPGATVCEGGVVQLFATGGNSYKWSPKDGLDNPYIANPIASPAATTSYTVTSTDGICFTASDVSVVTVSPQPYISVSADAEIVSGQNYQLYAYGNGNGTFVWSPPEFLSCTNCPNPTVVHPDKPMTYTVSMIDSNGCRREGEVKISLTCSDDAVYVPDAFTPNGDRRNDVFRVRSYGLQHVTYFRVFSRWGELMFETSDLNQGWDGTFKGQLCSPAVYVWYLEGVCSDGSALLKKGNVTLIR